MENFGKSVFSSFGEECLRLLIMPARMIDTLYDVQKRSTVSRIMEIISTINSKSP